jgi:hypothetical protein
LQDHLGSYAPFLRRFMCFSWKIMMPVRLHPLSILEYSWTSHIGSMTSQMIIEYATADNQVATVVLDGEEKRQPLGELVDILKARIS